MSSEKISCDGYKFKGWEIVTDKVKKMNGDYFKMPKSDVVIRAKWSKINVIKVVDGTVSPVKTHKITYNLNSGTVSGNPTTYNDNTDDFVLKRPTRSGYTFAGWTGTNLTEPVYNVTVDTSAGIDYTFTAKWLKNETPNYLDLPRTQNGCTLKDIYIDKEVGGNLTVFLDVTGSVTLVEAPTWANAGQTDIDWGPLTNIDYHWVREERAFNYAKTYDGKSAIKNYYTHVYLTCSGVRSYFVGYNYKLASVTYTLDYNNGTSKKVTSDNFNLGADVTIPSSQKPTKSGYIFIGWSTKATSPSDIIKSFRIANGGQTFYGTFVKTSNK